MNGLDIAIVCIMGFTLTRGLMTGLMQSISGLIGALAGFYGGYLYYPALAALLSKWINPGTFLKIVSFLIIFCGIVILISILGRLLKWIMKIAFLGWVDRLGGGVIGFLKGLVFVSALVIILTVFLPSGSPLLKKSVLLPYVSNVSETMMQAIPEDVRSRDFFKKMKSLKEVSGIAEKKFMNEKK